MCLNDQTLIGGFMDKNYDTPIKAIRKKCLDCTNGSRKEVRLCTIIECPLYPYRFGRRPTNSIVDIINEFYSKKDKYGG